MADVFHLQRGNAAIEDLRAVNGKRIAIFPINDLPRTPPFTDQSDLDRELPGDGVVDRGNVLAHWKAMGYGEPRSLELFNGGLWKHDPKKVCPTGLERMQALSA